MISIVVCSRDEADFQALQENMQASAGVPCEWIRIDNSRGEYSIFSAYNEGLRRSSGSYICFAHEDIRVLSPDWGKRCISYFQEHPELGLLGVLGSLYMPADADWRAFHNYRCGRLIQRFATLEPSPRRFSFHLGPKQEQHRITPVAAIDGMWMVIPASLKDSVHFDEESFAPFDLYDTDLALQIHTAGYQVGIAGDILIEHFSTGSFSPSYFGSLQRCLDKWKDHLPVDCRPVPSSEDSSAAMENFKKAKIAELSARARIEQGRDDFSPEEKSVIRDGVILFHHIYEKKSSRIADSLYEIDRSLADGWITQEEARTFRTKTWLYHTLLRFFTH